MKNLESKRLISIAVVTLVAIVALSGCTQEIQAAVLEKDKYCMEGERITISLNKVEELSEVGGWINIESDFVSGNPSEVLHRSVIVVCTGEGQYTVASRCNHKGWTLTYNQEDNILISSDGKRKFNMDGSVIGDKPKEPLNIYPYAIEDGQLIISTTD